MSLRKYTDFFAWMLREYTQKRTTAAIYNDLAAKNLYEPVVDYADRVRGLRYALSLVSNKFHTVLDIACGTGAFIDALHDKAKTKVIGIDISQGMLAVAKKRFQGQKTITLRQQSVLDASFPKSTFDLITLAHATRFIPHEQEQAFAKLVASWLKKDGTFVAILMIHPGSNLMLLLYRLTGLPRGFNLPMQGPKYFAQAMSTYLTLEKEVVINTHYKIFKSVAVYLRKK